MRCLLAAALAVLAVPVAAVGQDVAGRVLDIEFRVIDFDLRTTDLVLEGAEVGGEVVPLAVEETETEIRVELSADVLFDFDRSDIKDEAAASLKQVAELIRAHPDRPVRIEGYTDSKGSEAYNKGLSEDRAQSVADWLAEVEGLDGGTFDVVGFGEAKPVAPNEKPDGSDDPEGRQKNRRVEIVIGK
ncbi:MAG: OmpA family protein [Bauldia sp.]|nr:OmpA family protein [Bauldia sp.]